MCTDGGGGCEKRCIKEGFYMSNPFDLREFLEEIEKKDQLIRASGADLETEVGALTELNGQRQGPAMLFDKFEGYPDGLEC